MMLPVDPERWEFGSIYHWPLSEQHDGVSHPWDDTGVLYGSGRDALRSLMSLGRATRGWKRLWVPSYFCQGTIAALDPPGMKIAAYPCGPEDTALGLDAADTDDGDVILRMNFFGLHQPLSLAGIDRSRVGIIDDHTHDPWSDWAWESDADWCIASLRKVLPLPDGGVLWSPRGREMPPQPEVTDERRLASLEKLGAMALKGIYLAGHAIDREVYRRLAECGEHHLACREISGMPEWTQELLGCFPIREWRDCRKQNHRALSAALGNAPGVRVLQPEDATRMCPYLGVIVFDSEAVKDYVNNRLIENRVFLSVIWKMDVQAIAGIPPEHVLFSRHTLCVALDARYTELDIERVADMVLRHCAEYRNRSVPAVEAGLSATLTDASSLGGNGNGDQGRSGSHNNRRSRSLARRDRGG